MLKPGLIYSRIKIKLRIEMLWWCWCRAAEAEKERLSAELEQVWLELSSIVRAMYHVGDNDNDTDMFDSDRLTVLVTR